MDVIDTTEAQKAKKTYSRRGAFLAFLHSSKIACDIRTLTVKAHTWPDFIDELLCFSGHFMSLFHASCGSLVSFARVFIVSATHLLLL